MAKKYPTPQPLARYDGVVPGHLRELQFIAEAAGIAVNFGLLPDDDASLCTRLIATPGAFVRARLVHSAFQCVRFRHKWDGPFRFDFIRTAPDELCADMVEDIPQAVKQHGPIEIATYPTKKYGSGRAYWGHPEAIATALELSKEKLTPGKRGVRHSGYDKNLMGSRWRARFYPSGNVRLFWCDDPPPKASPEREPGVMFESPTAFAEHCERQVEIFSYLIRRTIAGNEYGQECPIRYDRGTVGAVSDALEHVRQLLQSAIPEVVQPQASAKRRFDGARADANFQAFLARLTDPGHEADTA